MTLTFSAILISAIVIIGVPFGFGIALIARNYKHEEMAGLAE